MSRPADMLVHDPLREHLKKWGLRRFESDAAYFQWQRETLSASELATLNALAEEKRRPGAGAAADIAFYDFTARPPIVPVLYSQRYDYYLAVGTAVTERIGDARSILDFGCGPGILTTFYAARFPDRSWVGMDRSASSLAAAREQAVALGLKNIRFEHVDIEHAPMPGSYDAIVATHALLQVEQDPGMPSMSWRSFERRQDPVAQAEFERRTGLSVRLEALRSALPPGGRLIAFEKTRQLARRIPFQRALAARGLRLTGPPVPIRYCLVEEVVDDGPLYTLSMHAGSDGVAWDESPERLPDEALYRIRGAAARLLHTRLPGRTVEREGHWKIPGLGSVRAERGTAAGFLSYWALSIDDRFHGIMVGPREGQATGRFGQDFDRAVADAKQVEQFVETVWPSTDPLEEPDAAPLYENHTASAQEVWSGLLQPTVRTQATFEEPDGRQRHIELGTAAGLTFLYWANTFDQRQLVLMEPQRAALLEQYYRESLQEGDSPVPG